MESLQAEMTKHPDLCQLRPSDVVDDPPDILFGNRRKGYFKAKHLCRVWVLAILKKLRARGEYFVCWEYNGRNYDGRNTLAHAFTIFYTSMHVPAMSVLFDSKGALKSTSKIFASIRRYDRSYMCAHICAIIYDQSYVIAHM